MDNKVRQHAEILVNHCTDVQEGDMVVISASSEAEELVTALYKELAEIGAHPVTKLRNSEASRVFYENLGEDHIREVTHSKAMWEETDVAISIRGSSNTKTMNSVDPEIRTKHSKANEETRELRLDCRWVLTQHPTSGQAQEAEMSEMEYADFVYDAIVEDWEDRKEYQSQMVEILEEGTEVRIESGDETQLEMSIDGMNPENDYGENNMPGGEVFTAPVRDSVNGTVLFDKPLLAHGREVNDVYLEFEDGEVTDYSASQNEEVIESVLQTDEGASYLGELGIGMNRNIDRFTYNMLFDEKMGDTVHLALGRAYDRNVGEDREQNQSAIHMDMIVDMSEDSRILVDGEVVQENGEFIFE